MRTRYIAPAKALVRRDGLRVPTSASAWVPTRIAELDLSPTLTTELAPLFAVFAPLNAQIAVADARIYELRIRAVGAYRVFYVAKFAEGRCHPCFRAASNTRRARRNNRPSGCRSTPPEIHRPST